MIGPVPLAVRVLSIGGSPNGPLILRTSDGFLKEPEGREHNRRASVRRVALTQILVPVAHAEVLETPRLGPSNRPDVNAMCWHVALMILCRCRELPAAQQARGPLYETLRAIFEWLIKGSRETRHTSVVIADLEITACVAYAAAFA